jgi:hypothetical protein
MALTFRIFPARSIGECHFRFVGTTGQFVALIRRSFQKLDRSIGLASFDTTMLSY